MFPSLLEFAQRRPSQFQQALAGPGTNGATSNPNINEFAFFVQDQWRVNARLTFNYGLRYDLFNPAKPPFFNLDERLGLLDVVTNRFDLDKNNWGPRLGFAYRVLNSGRLVLHGGWGIFYGRTPSILTGTVHTNNGVQIQNYSFTGAAVPVTYPDILTSIPASGRTPVSIFRFAPNFEQPQTHQASVSAEARAGDYLFTFGYLGVFGSKLNRSRDINLAPMSLFSGSLCTTTVATAPCNLSGPIPYFRHSAARPVQGYQRITSVESTAESDYNGVFLQVSKRFSHGFQIQTSYTFSKVIDDAPEGTAVLPGNAGDDAKIVWDTLNLGLDRGIGDSDVTHRWVLSGLWDIHYANGLQNVPARYVLGGWQLSTIVQASSGRVFSERDWPGPQQRRQHRK